MRDAADERNRRGRWTSDAAGGAPVDDAGVTPHPWSGYASDQGEPGDIEALDAPIAKDPDEDALVRADVARQLNEAPDLDVHDVDVDVVRGEVVLQGSVGSEDARRRTEVIARGTAGVRTVRNDLDVRTGELEPPEER